MAKFFLPIARHLSIKMPIKYYIGEGNKICEDNLIVQPVSFFYFIKKFVGMLDRLILRRKHNGFKRYLLEVVYDYLFSFSVKEPTVLVSAAYLKKSFKKNTELGGKNIFVAGNPDDNEIYRCLRTEMEKYNIKLNDPYTYLRRLKHINNSLKCVDHLILYTQSQFDTFLKNFDSTKIHYKESFIKPLAKHFPEIAVPKNECFTFCYIAHTVWLKGLIYLLEAWEIADLKNAKLVIGGSIDLSVSDYIKNNFSDLQNIEFIGHVRQLNEFFRQAHVTVIPSLLDAAPTTVSESLMCGTPVICTEGCGSKTLIDIDNGIVVPTANSAALAEALIKMYEKQCNNESNQKTIQNTLTLKTKELKDEFISEMILDIRNSLL